MYRSVWTLSCSREMSNLHDPFVVKVLKTDEIVLCARAWFLKLSVRRFNSSQPWLYVSALKAQCACAHNVTTPIIMLNFCEENFRDQKANHEIHENIVPQKYGSAL